MKCKLLLLALTLSVGANAQFRAVEPNPYGERPVIVPVPNAVQGVGTPCIILNDEWTSDQPQGGPGRRMAPGGGIVNMQRTVAVPSEFSGHRIIIRFNGTGELTTLYVNGREIRSHWGSLSSWSADITEAVTPGQTTEIGIKVDMRNQGLARFTPHRGAITGDVQLFAVPETYIQRMRVDTDFDNDYKDATLQLWLKTSDLALAGRGKVKVQLISPEGRTLKTSPSTITLPSDLDEFKYDVSVKNPRKWDAEHPVLYTLKLSLVDEKGKSLETLERKIGFREVELRGKQLFVNGDEVKFRGVWGVQDAKAIRDMNCNHVREKFNLEPVLDSCDVYGVYVLQENCVDFAKYAVQEDPQYASQWLELIEDLMERSWNHPSVIMWGLGNESLNGRNTLLTHKYVKSEDSQRPTIFSWANRVKDDEEIPYDIYSFHYPGIADPEIDLSKPGRAVWHSDSKLLTRPDCPEMPVLADECCHVCLVPAEAQRDPNVRNFWGESIKHFWDLVWNTKGALGGDQFGIFSDIKRRTMPEPWLMRKAYSPAVIRKRDYTAAAGKPLEIEIENRFCHTNLDECSIRWSVGGRSGVIKGPDVAPRGTGKFIIPFKEWKDNEKLELQISRADGFQVDEYSLNINPAEFHLPAVSEVKPVIEENQSEFIVKGKDFSITFNKYSGQITNGSYKGTTVITGGPHLQFVGSNISESEFWPDSITAEMVGNEAVVKIDAIYSPIKVGFVLRIDGDGMIRATYVIKHFPDPAPAPTTIPWDGASIGGFSEIGLYFKMPGDVDRIEWSRRGLWSAYPEDHIGREEGIAYREPKADPSNWKDSAGDHKFSGGVMAESTISNDFRASKEYIRYATALLKGSNIGLEALSEEKDAVRVDCSERGDQTTMYINNLWNYPTLGIGNWMKPAIIIEDGYTNTVYVRMTEM